MLIFSIVAAVLAGAGYGGYARWSAHRALQSSVGVATARLARVLELERSPGPGVTPDDVTTHIETAAAALDELLLKVGTGGAAARAAGRYIRAAQELMRAKRR